MRIPSLAAAAAATLATLTLSGPAMAVAWGSSTAPLVAYEGGVAQAKGYGNFVNQGGVYAQNNSLQYDLKPGGNAVTVKTNYFFLKTCNGTPNQWCSVGKVDSPGSTSASWQGMWTRKPLDPVAQNARGSIEVCEVQAWSGDPCSVSAVVSFAY